MNSSMDCHILKSDPRLVGARALGMKALGAVGYFGRRTGASPPRPPGVWGEWPLTGQGPPQNVTIQVVPPEKTRGSMVKICHKLKLSRKNFRPE